MNATIENNFKHHPPTDEQVAKYAEIRSEAKALALQIDKLCPASREKSLALTNLEQAVMWANAAIARNPEAQSGSRGATNPTSNE